MSPVVCWMLTFCPSTTGTCTRCWMTTGRE
nr:MAG TPA: hypothetical protein [Caudoviricetes sp.]